MREPPQFAQHAHGFQLALQMPHHQPAMQRLELGKHMRRRAYRGQIARRVLPRLRQESERPR